MKKTIFLLSLFIFFNHANSMEDSDYEQHVHNVYLKHYKDPVSNSDWNNKLQSLPTDYKLKFKDNLWDLSASFFKDSLYWSKMWVANPEIENPHLIYKGNSLKLDPQSLARVNTSKYSVDIQSQFPGLIIPLDESSKGALTVDEIPSSLPKLLNPEIFSVNIDIKQLKAVKIENKTITPFYLTDQIPISIGEIVSKNGYGESIGLGGDQLIIRVEGGVSIGSILTVFENKGRIGNFLQVFSGFQENEIVIKGKIKILSFLQGTESLFLAEVIETLKGMAPGDSLLRTEAQTYNFSQKGDLGTGDGVIIGNSDKNQIILSLGSIIYLNRGYADSVRKGDIFYVRGNVERSEIFKRPYKYEKPLLGKLRVIHTARNVSTGIIIESENQIYVGDIFSGSSDRVEDLGSSEDYEKIENQEDDSLVDYEEVPKDKTESSETEEDSLPEGDSWMDYEEVTEDQTESYESGEGEKSDEAGEGDKEEGLGDEEANDVAGEADDGSDLDLGEGNTEEDLGLGEGDDFYPEEEDEEVDFFEKNEVQSEDEQLQENFDQELSDQGGTNYDEIEKELSDEGIKEELDDDLGDELSDEDLGEDYPNELEELELIEQDF